MRFGHYTNEELGIKRNITCSMFESKGVQVTPAKDVECGAKPGTKVLSEALLAQHLHDSYDNEPGNGKSLKSYIDASVKHILDIARENDIKRDPALMRKWIKEEIIGAYKELTHLSIKDSPENRKQMKRILQQFDSYITKSVLQARLKHKDLFMSNEIDEAKDIECATKKTGSAKNNLPLSDYIDEYLGGDSIADEAKRIYEYAKDEITHNRTKYKNMNAKKVLESEAAPCIQDIMREANDASMWEDWEDDLPTVKKKSKQVMDKLMKAVYAYAPKLQKLKDGIDKQNKNQLGITHFLEYIEDQLQSGIEDDVEGFYSGRSINYIKNNETKIDAQAKKVLERNIKEILDTPPWWLDNMEWDNQNKQKKRELDAWLSKNKGRLLRQTIASLHEQKILQIEEIAEDINKQPNSKKQMSQLEQLAQICDATIKNGKHSKTTKECAGRVKAMYEKSLKALNAQPNKPVPHKKPTRR